MALEKSLIPVVLNGGLDTKTDEKLVVQGKLVDMINCHMQRGGALTKRNGFAGIAAYGDTFSSIDHLSTTSSGELIAVGRTSQHGDCLCTYNTLYDSWVYRSRFSFLSATVEVISSSDGSTYYTDASYNSTTGFVLATWINGTSAYYTVYNPSNGQKILPVRELTSTTKIFPVANDTGGHVIYVTGGALKVQALVSQSPFGSPLTISGVSTSAPIEACALSNGNIVIAAVNSGTQRVSFFVVNASGVLVSTTATPITIGNYRDFSICKGPASDALDTHVFTIATSVTNLTAVDIYTFQHDINGTLLWWQKIDSGIVTEISDHKPSVGSVCDGSTLYTFVSSKYASPQITSNCVFKIVTVIGSVSPSYPERFRCNTVLASLPWVYDGHVYALFYYQSSNDSTMAVFVLDEVGNPVCIIPNVTLQPGTNHLEIDKLRGGMFTGIGVKTRISSVTSFGVEYQLSAGIVLLARESVMSSSTDATTFTGGFARDYDSESLTESSFLMPADRPFATMFSSSSYNPTLSIGTYGFKIVYEWIDCYGNKKESQPSTTFTLTTTALGAYFIVVIPALVVTLITSKVSVVVYRTDVNGTIFYRDGAILNNSFGNILRYNTQQTNENLITKQLLYTTGYVLPNQNPGRVSSLLISKSRAFMAGLQDDSDIWYSKYIRPGSAISMTGSFALTTSPGGGGITALGEIDDKVVVFKRAAIYIVSGEGPNDAGQGSALSNPQFLTSDVGCTDPRSVVRTPAGLMFKSAKGIYLLDRNLATSYIGAPVERYNSSTVTGTYLDDSKSQVRFTTNGVTLVFDYYWQQWSVFDHMEATACCEYLNKMVYATATKVYQEYAGYMDKGVTPVVMTIKTSWIAVSGLAGFERLYGVQILGKFVAAHTLNVAFAFDYRNVIDETMAWTPPLTDDDGVYRAEFRQAQQKCTSVQLTISDTPPVGGNAGMEINALTLYAGGKKGFAKLRISRYGQTV